MADPKVIGYVRKAAAQTGADPVALLADSIVESEARTGAVGDVASGHPSYGPWQMRSQVGALGSHSPAWANSYQAALNRAQEFARLQVHGGIGAAKVQRPANAGAYALKVDAAKAQARQLLGATAPTTTNPVLGRQPQVSAPLIGQPSAPDTVDNTLIQHILDSNAKLAGISSFQIPVAQPIAPRATPAPVKVSKDAQGTGPVDQTGKTIVNVARTFLGVPYLWGGTTRKGLDCSALLQIAAKQAGVTIPRTTYQQIKVGQPIPPNQIQPGDAVFFGNASAPHHVGISIGGGRFIEAPHSGSHVRISTLAGRKDFVAARRYA